MLKGRLKLEKLWERGGKTIGLVPPFSFLFSLQISENVELALLQHPRH